jgi:hypothetical protein
LDFTAGQIHGVQDDAVAADFVEIEYADFRRTGRYPG